MTHEERANWIRRGIILLLAVAVGAGAWFYPKKKPDPKVTEPNTTAEPAIVYDLEITHFHQPKNPASEQVGESLDRIAQKFNKQVRVTHLDITKDKEAAKQEGIREAPRVVIMTGSERAFAFDGLWSHPQIEQKVEEILRGLERVGKDWLPEVKGMSPAN